MRSAAAEALTQFVFWSKPAPYRVQTGATQGDGTRVVPATCKTGLGAARRTMLVHNVEAIAAVFVAGRVTYGARWACGDAALDAVIVRDAGAMGGLCPRCADKDLYGPTVYRFFDRAGHLLYVGSTINWPARRRAHQKKAPWWSEVAEEHAQRCADMVSACAAEALAIQTEHPRCNRLLRRRPVPARRAT